MKFPGAGKAHNESSAWDGHWMLGKIFATGERGSAGEARSSLLTLLLVPILQKQARELAGDLVVLLFFALDVLRKPVD